MGQQVKWPPKMKASDFNRNPKRWCDFYCDHGHNTEDSIALKIEVNELIKRGHLREFLSNKARNLLKKEGHGLPTEAAPADRKNGQEAEGPKRLLLGTDEISFTVKEQEKVLTPHHDALAISLTIANCLVKRILVDNGSSINIIFQSAYADLGLEPKVLTRKATPLIGFSGEVKQSLGEVLLPVYAEGINQATKFLVVDCPSSYNVILGRPWIHDMGAIPSTLHQLIKFPTPWGIKLMALHTEEMKVEEMDEVLLAEGNPERNLKIGSKLAEGLGGD
ncbi:uncharacterized protein LOC130495723 [Raphanus sativus]|uniref:Uncharacterized protein LOC130495723 n=1 Tax=Raphanus sativus TaxID=3726 RepID=A0A9W3BV86_RAPSA|nr:uncharacterized protein LOC130495723 [Raphanus sativus]